MKCAEARSLIGLYVDDALDAERTWEISRHLESCAECRARFDGEWRLEARIEEELRRERGDERSVFERIERRALGPRIPRSAAVLGAAAAVVIVVLLARTSGSAPYTKLLELALADHAEYEAGELEPADTGVGARAGAFLEETLGLAGLRFPGEDPWRVIGARVCVFEKGEVGYVMLRREREPVSLYVVPTDHTLVRSEESDRPVCRELSKGVSGVAARVRDLVVVAVGSIEPAELSEIALAVR